MELNLFVLSDLTTNFLTWEAPKNQDVENLYLNILSNKDKEFYQNAPKLLLHDSYLEKKKKV